MDEDFVSGFKSIIQDGANLNYLQESKEFINTFEILALEKLRRGELKDEVFFQIIRLLHYFCFKDLTEQQSELGWIVLDLDGCLCQKIFSDKNEIKDNTTVWKRMLYEDKAELYCNLKAYSKPFSILKGLARLFNIWILTGRCERFREVTEKWLSNNQFEFFGCSMMAEEWEDYQEYLDWKFLFFKENRDKIVLVIDDDWQVIKQAKELNLPFFFIEKEEDWDLFKILSLIPISSSVVRQIVF